ncbi:22757_t:CDS:2 [Gigaspora margarita]|uniref:22757_t:CDS:1 n=1 Tax=Gigaspora margarita TaxID=4874 RepID=A0ABM8W3J7_GIGMA|nr:22757_t:CDS:2 [Gigaspora margarita]
MFKNLKLHKVINYPSNELKEVKNMIIKLTKTVNNITKRLNPQRKHQPMRKVVKEEEAIIKDCLRIEIDLGYKAFNVKALRK